MPLVRKFAVQGHEVPSSAYRAHGPFPPEVLAQNSVDYEYEHSDSLHEALDDVRMFRCRYCGDVLYEDELDSHDCEYEEEEE
jgi:hypothetical protein